MSFNEKIRLLMVGWWFYPETSAGANRLMDVIKYMDVKKFDIYVLTRKTSDTPYKSVLRIKSSLGTKLVRIYRVPGISFLSWLNPFAFIGFFLSTLVLLKIKKINIVLTTIPEPENVFGASLAINILKKPYIVDIRDLWENARIDFIESKHFPLRHKGIKEILKCYNILLKKIFIVTYRKSKALIVVTSEMAKIAKQRKLNKRIIVIPNAADTEIFKPLSEKEKRSLRKKYGINENEIVVLFQGHLNPEYRLDQFIIALKKLVLMGQNNVSLLILGKAPDWSEGKRILDYVTRKLGLEKKVRYLGYFRDRKKVAEIVGMADIGIIPMDISPLWRYRVPLKFYEYMACGIPVIAFCSRESELCKVIEKYKCGYTVTESKKVVTALVNVLLRIIGNKEEINRLSKNAIKVSHVFNRKITTKLFERVIKALIS